MFTEASKKILEYLAAISTHSVDVKRIKDRLLESNPVLEVKQVQLQYNHFFSEMESVLCTKFTQVRGNKFFKSRMFKKKIINNERWNLVIMIYYCAFMLTVYQ